MTIDLDGLRTDLLSDFLLFLRTFFKIITGREFYISRPLGRESHFVTVARELTLCAKLQTTSLLINMPPGYSKSTMVSYWTAWTLAMYPDSQYLYISYGHDLASKHTEMIKRIVSCNEYKALFGVQIRSDSKAKDHFRTTSGGSIKAFGSAGSIVGQDGGLPNESRFTGAVILDDLHKIDEAHSDTRRTTVIENYRETIIQRPRAPNVPVICIGQRVHEADIAAYMLSGEDERNWKTVILKALDESGNALYPEVNSVAQLLEKKEKNPYVFSSQFQQEPVPAGGAVFKTDWFPIMDFEPDIIMTFVTGDTAETDKEYNDATVFSFFGLYEIELMGKKTGEYGLHWLDCLETRIEPKDLKETFIDFLGDCMRHKIPPQMAAIEKKSTGTTLLSVLKDIQGIQIRDIQRNGSSGSKTQRFLECQPYVASKRISFTKDSKHVERCITHCTKITANDSHRHDDIMDTLSDAIKIALIDKSLMFHVKQNNKTANLIKTQQKIITKARQSLYNSD